MTFRLLIVTVLMGSTGLFAQGYNDIQPLARYGGTMGPVAGLIGDFAPNDPWFTEDLMPAFIERNDHTARIDLSQTTDQTFLSLYDPHEFLIAKVALAAVDFDDKEHRENFMVTVLPDEEALVAIGTLKKRGFDALLLLSHSEVIVHRADLSKDNRAVDSVEIQLTLPERGRAVAVRELIIAPSSNTILGVGATGQLRTEIAGDFVSISGGGVTHSPADPGNLIYWNPVLGYVKTYRSGFSERTHIWYDIRSVWNDPNFVADAYCLTSCEGTAEHWYYKQFPQ